MTGINIFDKDMIPVKILWKIGEVLSDKLQGK